MNKQKIDWVERPQWKCDLAIIMGKLFGYRNADFDTPVEDFISTLLQQQRIIGYSQGMTQGYIDGVNSGEKSRVEYAKKVREEIIKEIEGIVGEDENYRESTNDFEVCQIRNQLRKEIREKLDTQDVGFDSSKIT